MSFSPIVPILVMSVAAGPACAAGSGADDVAAVIHADRHLNELIIAHDARQAAALYTDDFVLTTSSGRTKRKADLLSEINATDLALDINETNEVAVRVHGDVAVLTGILRQHGSYRGAAVDVRLRVTDTWVRSALGWQLLAGHAGNLAAR